MVWTPRRISSRRRSSTTLLILSTGASKTQLVDLLQHLAADLLAADLDERGQMRERDRLTAVLAAGDLRDDLRGDVAGGREAVRALDERAGDDRAVLQHVLEVDQVAVVHVLREVVGVVEVDDALLVRLDDVLRQQHAHGQVLGHLACHVVALHRVDGGVLVGVLLLDLLVVALDEGQDAVVGGVCRALEALHVAVDDVAAGDVVAAGGHDLVLDHVLDLLDRHGVAGALAQPLDAMRRQGDLIVGEAVAGISLAVGALDGADDLLDVEGDLGAASLDDLHVACLSSLRSIARVRSPSAGLPSAPRGHCLGRLGLRYCCLNGNIS